jgi:hypothetical protein
LTVTMNRRGQAGWLEDESSSGPGTYSAGEMD